MGKRTIISAEMRLLNRLKKKKIHTIAAMLSIFFVFTVSSVTFSILEVGAGWGTKNRVSYATSTDALDTDNDTEAENADVQNTEGDTTTEDADAQNTEGDTRPGDDKNDNTGHSDADDTGIESDIMQGNTDFQVPDTALPAVDTVNGNDWYDPSVYAPLDVEEVGDSYFDASIFIGDSRTEGLALYGGQNNMNAFSYKGLSVDKISTEKCITIDGVRYTVAEAIEKTDYDNYYIQFGINELGWIYVDKFADDISILIDVIYEHNPDANVYVSNILPVAKSVSDTDEVFNIDNVKKFNKIIYDMCVERGDVIYLDIASSVSDENGYLPEEASTDGKHCNADYCKRIIKYIRLHTYEKVDG